MAYYSEVSMPAISVIMPAYNHERFVGAATESVLKQSFSDLELVVVDDGSKWGSVYLNECDARCDRGKSQTRSSSAQ